VILIDNNSPSPRAASPDDIEGEEDNLNDSDTHPPDLMEDINMSEQGSDADHASIGEEILDFPGSDQEEAHTMGDMDMEPSGDVPDLVVPDVAVSTKVTQVGVWSVQRGVESEC
jgi:hypothetical protein